MSQLVDVLVAKTHKSPIVQVDEKALLALLASGEGKISNSLLVHVRSLVKFPPWVPFTLALEDYICTSLLWPVKLFLQFKLATITTVQFNSSSILDPMWVGLATVRGDQ